MTEIVDNDIRDEVMENILAKPQNQICFDCGSKAPKWSSPYLGIVICYECAAKHRSYGTHISFVRSVDLDKWNRKQLKSLELTGNSYTKQRFNDLGVPLIGNNFDYNNSLVLKVRQEIEEKVRESLQPGEYMKEEEKQKEVKEQKVKKTKKKKKEKKDDTKNDDDNKVNEENNVEENNNTNNIQNPKPFDMVQIDVKDKGKPSKKNKIKKVDFDFDFDSFNDVNFSDFNKKDDEKEEEKVDSDSEKKEKKEKEKERESEEGYVHNSYDKKKRNEINKKLANKKAISSEDYAALENDDYNNKMAKEKIKSMGNMQAISSEDVFGTEGGPSIYEGKSFTDKLKDMALDFTLSAAEKAKQLKNKTSELINKVQNKFSGSGY